VVEAFNVRESACSLVLNNEQSRRKSHQLFDTNKADMMLFLEAGLLKRELSETICFKFAQKTIHFRGASLSAHPHVNDGFLLRYFEEQYWIILDSLVSLTKTSNTVL